MRTVLNAKKAGRRMTKKLVSVSLCCYNEIRIQIWSFCINVQSV